MTDSSLEANYLVVPGQVIATTSSHSSSGDGDGLQFLRGHGTYVDRQADSDNDGVMTTSSVLSQDHLVASVCGVVERVNKLVSVIPVASSLYVGHVGDLVVGQITSVASTRWKVQLVQGQRDAQLPLSGVHLPGGVQRIRTAEDQRDMRNILQEGDWISAEVHNVQKDGSLVLHTRSLRYGKLSNGCWISVPPALIPRRKNHYMTMMNLLDVLWGTNGCIWIQRKLPLSQQSPEEDLAERQEELRKEHAAIPVNFEERQAICRFRNAIECLRLVQIMVSPENVQTVYELSKHLRPAEMVHPQNIIELTATLRRRSNLND